MFRNILYRFREIFLPSKITKNRTFNLNEKQKKLKALKIRASENIYVYRNGLT